MPHIYPEVKKLEGKDKIGDGNCVALVQVLTKVGTLVRGGQASAFWMRW